MEAEQTITVETGGDLECARRLVERMARARDEEEARTLRNAAGRYALRALGLLGDETGREASTVSPPFAGVTRLAR